MTERKGGGRRLAAILWAVFVIALVMGPGPGVLLVNPDPSDPATRHTVLGMPIVYFWAAAWFLVQLAVVFVAYFRLWSRQEGRPAARN